MEARDLMIGDWVSIDGTPAKVMHFTETHFYTDKGVVAPYWVYPIHITAAILERNGFTKDFVIERTSEVLYYKSADGRIEISDQYTNSFNEWHVHVDTEDMRSMLNCELTYVHELQHVLRLCKIDKEIKL